MKTYCSFDPATNAFICRMELECVVDPEQIGRLRRQWNEQIRSAEARWREPVWDNIWDADKNHQEAARLMEMNEDLVLRAFQIPADKLPIDPLVLSAYQKTCPIDQLPPAPDFYRGVKRVTLPDYGWRDCYSVQENIQALIKALEAGNYSAAPGSLLPGPPLQIESLDAVFAGDPDFHDHAPPVCECGSTKCGSPAHSGWCPLFKKEP